MPHDLPTAYNPSLVEDEIYRGWEASGAFNPDTFEERTEVYSIMMPPPNVTGILHIGHVLENALMDTMARFQRLRGKKVLILPGTDHAALPTQAKVEKFLIQQGMTNPRQELGREKLVEKIREFAEQSKSTILSQVKKLGTSCDWSRLAFTFDEARSKAVNEMFRRMHEDGLIYRGSRVVNWSVKGQSTCSDDEVVYVERASKLYTFKYGPDFPITISTTRPETKLGDTAVAVHPSDTRYQKYIGKTYDVDVGAREPLHIKIITDEGVDPNFGTGALGVTPAHSPIDFEMYEKQKAKGDPIGLMAVIGLDGLMTDAAGLYAGSTVEAARDAFVASLREKGLLEKEEEITQSVGTSDRFGDIIEAIPMTQWWLDVNKIIPGRGKSLKDLMREVVTGGLNGDVNQRVTMTPMRFEKLYLDRVDHLRDWCLSRQIWWGHRIPVWYQGDEMRVSETSPGSDWEQDPDTLDTWFSSGTWTFSTLGWPKETKDLKTFHPTTWIQMGYEILYLWLMRMILMSSYVRQEIPFKDAYIHGMLRDESGKKFSKSAGNNIDPIEVIEKYGCDALRWSVLIGTTPGNDSRFYWEKAEAGRHLVNKLWNVSRFILSVIPTSSVIPSEAEESLSESDSSTPKTLADEWILSRLEEVIASVTEKLEKYDFSLAGEELRDFTWNDLADWYLEIVKIEKGETGMLTYLLSHLLRLWHPFMPFVTEHIWKTANFSGMLILEKWPVVAARSPRLPEGQGNPASTAFETIRTLVTDIRRLRSEQGIEAAKFVEVVVVGAQHAVSLQENAHIIKHLARLSSLEFVEAVAQGWATTMSGAFQIGLNVMGTIDVAKEREKISQEIEETQRYIVSQQQKLENQEFISKAPSHIVDGMRQKMTEAEQKLAALKERIATLR